MRGVLLELEGCIGDATERNGQPEIDRPVGEYCRKRLCIRQAEARQQQGPGRRLRHRPMVEREGDHGGPRHLGVARGNRNGGQDIGQAVGHEQVHRGDEVAEGCHEYPQ